MVKSTSGIVDPILIQQAVERIVSRIDKLAQCSETPTGLKRTFCSSAMKDAHQLLTSWMQSAGLTVELDAAGNLIGATDHDSAYPILILGSHLDTVVNAGRFDGGLGVLLGVAVAEVLCQENSSLNLPFNIHVVGFSEEEGVRFQLPFIGSMALAGSFDGQQLDKTDENNVSLTSALNEFGCPADFQSASYGNRNIVGFLEAHIEQATCLQDHDLPVGVVSAIAGQTRATIRVSGCAGHAGTVPHDRRQDALAAAAEIILLIEKIGRETDGLFATVGSVDCSPGITNAICGQAQLRLDLRHENDSVRETAIQQLEKRLSVIAQERGVCIDWADVDHSPAVPMDGELKADLESAIQSAGYISKSMVSGAGHDAMIMSQIAPSSMLFVRCRDGISHHPDEYVTREDIEVALRVMVRAVVNIGNRC